MSKRLLTVLSTALIACSATSASLIYVFAENEDKTSSEDLLSQKQDLDNQLNNARSQLVKDQAALPDAKINADKISDSDIENANKAVNDAYISLDSAKSDYENVYADYNSALENLNNEKDKQQSSLSDLNDAMTFLSEKNEKLNDADSELQNAENDLNSRKKDLDDANKAVSDAEEKAAYASELLSKLKDMYADQDNSLENAKADLDAAENEKAEAEKAFDDLQNSTLYQSIWVSTDPVNKPVSGDRESVFSPVIPEAEGAKVTYLCDSGGWIYQPDLDICTSLNNTGSYTAPLYNVYTYQGDGYTYTTSYRDASKTPLRISKEVGNIGEHRIKAVWTDSEGIQHNKHIILVINSNDYDWNSNDYEKWAESVIAKIIKPSMSSYQKAVKITDYVYQDFKYDYRYSNGYSMLKHGGGDCWASTDMIMELGEAAGFKALSHNDNYVSGSGAGHMNAWLYSPSDNQYYECEAGYDEPSRGSGYGSGSTWNITNTEFIIDKTDARYSGGFYSGGAEDIPGVIGLFTHYGDTEVHVPTDSKYTTLGGRSDGYFSSGPFDGFLNLQTVYIGKNITKIEANVYSHRESANIINGEQAGVYGNAYKFVVDKANPNYASDSNGALYKKNADGTTTLLAAPSGRNHEISDTTYYINHSKTNKQIDSEYIAAKQRKEEAEKKLESSAALYNSLLNSDYLMAIADAEKQLDEAQESLEEAKNNSRRAAEATASANEKISSAESAKDLAESELSNAQKKVENAQLAVNNAGEKVKEAEKAASDIKLSVDEKKGLVDSAQNAVDNAESNLKTISETRELPEKLENEIAELNKSIPVLQNEINDMSERIEKAKHEEEALQSVTVYRLYNPNDAEHLYTTDKIEYDSLKSIGWNGEGAVFNVSTTPNYEPVYRLYNQYTGAHLFSNNQTENDNLVKAGWKAEGIKFYGSEADDAVDVIRYYNRYNGQHIFTADEIEMRTLEKAGWEKEYTVFKARKVKD